MSAVQPMLPPRCSPSFPPGEVEGCGGPEPPSGGPVPPSGGPEPPSGGPEMESGGPEMESGGPVPPSGGPVPPSGGPEMESLRMFLNQRLTAAVDDILGVFGRTVARYREEIDRQRRQLDSLRSEDSRWKRAADLLQTFSWMKNCPEDQVRCVQLDQTGSVVETEAGHVDPGAAADGSDTEDSRDWREAAGPRKPEDTGDTEGQSSRPSAKVRSPKVRSPKVRSPTEHKPSHQLLLDFTCQVCGGSFQRRSHLLKHTAAHLRDCGVCGKHLERTESLKLHLRVHRDTSFHCSVCGQTFTLRGNLRTHMRIHSGERPYGCTVCEKSFGRRATLVRHMRSHTGEKPFSCTFCGRGFVEKGNLTVHLRTHTGERPYWCSACGRRFSQLSCYYKHPCQRGLTCPPDRMNT